MYIRAWKFNAVSFSLILNVSVVFRIIFVVLIIKKTIQPFN
jgi:hypothetical protein